MLDTCTISDEKVWSNFCCLFVNNHESYFRFHIYVYTHFYHEGFLWKLDHSWNRILHSQEPRFLGVYWVLHDLGIHKILIQRHFCFYSHVIEYSFLILQQIKYFFRQTSVFLWPGNFYTIIYCEKKILLLFFIIILKPFSPILFLNNVGSMVKTSDLIMIRVGFPRGEIFPFNWDQTAELRFSAHIWNEVHFAWSFVSHPIFQT